jgi:hypothetical protein
MAVSSGPCGRVHERESEGEPEIEEREERERRRGTGEVSRGSSRPLDGKQEVALGELGSAMQLLHEEDKTALQKAPSGLEILQGF